jgi:biopolymer transport protein ExbB
LNHFLIPNAFPLLLAQESEPAKSGIFEIVFSGGIIGFAILAVLLAISATAAYLVFDQIMALRRSEIVPDDLSELVRQSLNKGDLAAAQKVCQDRPSVLSFVLLAGFNEVDGGWLAVEKSMEEALAEQSARLFRKVEYLSVIGNIAPMVGLLGTVIGIIFSFQAVAGQGAGSGSDGLAQGIYQALVTTAGGLLIAIPSLGAFAVFRNRIDQLIAETAYAAQHAMLPVKRHRRRSGQAAAGPVAVNPGTSPPPTAPPTAPPKGS